MRKSIDVSGNRKDKDMDNMENNNADIRQIAKKWHEGLDLAEYAMIKEKALKNDSLVMTDNQGGTVKVPAKELLKIIYGEEQKSE
jgi:hypothetical protein